MTQRQDRDRECGRHSAIPECCIQYFLDVWDPLFFQADGWPKVEARQALVRVFERIYGIKSRYIPCETCLLNGHVIVLQRCPPDCWRYEARRKGRVILQKRRAVGLS